jgi:hypothetical protein
LTLTTPSREPGRYGRPSFFATTPSNPAACSVRSHSVPCSTSSETGDSSKPSPTFSSSARRFSIGRSCTGLPFQSSRSKATKVAGISAASLRTRLSAGWRRICIASKSSAPWRAITISPSSAERFGISSPSGRSSGK